MINKVDKGDDIEGTHQDADPEDEQTGDKFQD